MPQGSWTQAERLKLSASAPSLQDMETSSIITTLGGGSGIDMAGLARNLATAQFEARSNRLARKSETLDRQISVASALKGKILQLASALGDRVRTGDLSPQPIVANSSVAAATRLAGGTVSGSFSLEVTSLAAGQTLASPSFASATASVGSGVLTLRFGSMASGQFSADTSRSAVDVTISSNATLADAAAAINAKGAGVTAYVANTTTGAKLMLKGEGGGGQAFILEAAEAPGEPGLSQLAWNPSSGDPARLLKSAANAAFKVDGLEYSSATNTADQAIPGVSLKLLATNIGTPTQISFNDPTPAINSAMQDLTAALNDIAADLKSATDPKTGDLARDTGALALRKSLGALAGTVILPGAVEGEPKTLSDLGLATERDGSFRLDSTRLANTLRTNAKGAGALFTADLFGVFSTIDRLARTANSVGNPGSIAGSISRYSAQKIKTTDDQSKLTEAQEKLRTQLVSRFAKTDTRVGASRATLSFIQNQVDIWSGGRN